ncbi:MAG: OmpA family protein [Sideroxydans sp.]|jgi:outer membrane protein OmpA-like peptidoglycan-associated protein
MKKIILGLLLVGVAAAAQASQFSGGYVGLNIGQNTSSQTSLADKKEIYPGLKAGYNKDIGSFLLGGEVFGDVHGGSYTKEDLGLDARLGLPMNNWMPYLKLGVAGTEPGSRLHAGLGVEYSLSDRWSINAEYTTDKKDAYKNNNIALGINGFFGDDSGKAGAAAAASAAAAKAAADKAAADAAAKEAADKAAAAAAAKVADQTAAGRAAAAKAAADKAAADAAAAAKAAADKAAADAAAKAAEPAYKTLLTDKPVTLEGASFASGSSKLNVSANAQLDDIVKFAADNKDAGLTIVGYTDDRGNAAKNVKLSAARAAAVKAYLVGKGVAADRVTTKGAGSANPIGDNKTDAGRAQNRRVEIKSVITEVKKVQVK